VKRQELEKLARPEPFVCPVCGGRGSMPNWFYSDSSSTAELHSVSCRTCKGEGIVWAPDPRSTRMTKEQAAVVRKFATSCKEVPAITEVHVHDEPDNTVTVVVTVNEFSPEVLRAVAELELQAVEDNPLIDVEFHVKCEGDEY